MSQMKIVHLSDPHFGTILPGVQEGLLVTLHELHPDLILITGDITQRARRQQFLQAKEFTHLLKPTPIIAVPGNHDIPLFNIFARAFNPYGGFKNLFKDQLEKDHHFGDITITGLNSTSQWRHIQGDFNLKRLDRRLKKNQLRAEIHIAAFHHPMDCKKKSDEKNLLRGRNEAIQLFEKYQVDLIVGGHIHDPMVGLSSHRYPNLSRQMIIGVAGTCLSWRIRPGAPNSFNLIEVDTTNQPTLTLSRYDQRKDLRFTFEESRRYQRDRNRSWHEVVTTNERKS